MAESQCRPSIADQLQAVPQVGVKLVAERCTSACRVRVA